MFSLDELFTHCEVLNSREPQTEENFDNNPTSSDEFEKPSSSSEEEMLSDFAYLHCPKVTKTLVSGRDFISMLKNGWNAVYKEDPVYKNLYDPKNGKDDLEEQLLAGPWGTVIGKGRTKKLAQHRAAAEVLLKIIDAGRHKEFFIPGRDAAEAGQIITTMMNETFGTPASATNVLGSNPASPAAQNPKASNAANETPPPSAHPQNWVGKVQEFVQKRSILCQWKDDYQQTGKGTDIEHNCRVVFDFLDGNKQVIEQLFGTGQARNKKAAKQQACKEILDQLHQKFGGGTANSNHNQATATPQQPPPASPKNAQEPMDVSSSSDFANAGFQPINPKDDRYALTLTSEEVMELEEKAAMALGDEDRPNIQLMLGTALNNRDNVSGAEKLLRHILALKDSQVERVFAKAELKFVDSAKSQIYDIFQIYLEIWITTASNKRLLLCTFGGQGPTKEAAKDDASWQALEFLYIFGGFAPTKSAEDGEEEWEE